jgi:hypothetical protein
MDKPNYTQIPNVIIDDIMPQLTDTAYRVLTIIARQTFGWIEDKETGRRKEKDWISYSQLMIKANRARASIASALKELEEKSLINILDEAGNFMPKETRAGKRLFYRVATTPTSSKSELVQKVNQFKIDTATSSKTEHTKETLTKEIHNINNINKNNLDKENNLDIQDTDNKNNLDIQHSKEYLTSISQEDIKELERLIGVKEERILREAQRAYDWLESKGKRYKNYKAFFRNWLRNTAEREGITPSKEEYTERQLYLRDLFARVALRKPGANDEAERLVGEDRNYFIKLFWGMVDK